MRLIDADVLKKAIYGYGEDSIDIDSLTELIEQAPTIEPVKGKWLYECYKGMHPVGYKRPEYRCSVCKCWAVVDSSFCPNCGADMRED